MIYRLILFTILYFSMQACGQGKKANKEPYTNALIHESSPYLLEHAHNPVDWHPWNEETLQKAKEESKPIIISIGYAACHWCHVMERETFSDTVVANFMNANFIAIKIDREERPDVDQVYMNAAQLISGHGGWPLNAFALPDGKPFYAGTYFPRENWMHLLEQIVKLYKNDKSKLIQQAEAITEGIRSQELISTKEDQDKELNANEYKKLFTSWKKIIDTKWGGFQGAPKFPLPFGWEFLLQYHYITKDQQALDAVTTTLDKMALGGIYDQIGGGFARYATDEYWRVPHFEKMLYDNGQLVSLYAHAYQVTRKKQYADIIEETLAFVERELATKEGAFYSSLNADSEDEEGKFYVWTEEEVKIALGTKAQLILEYYQVSSTGNWEGGKNILNPKLTKAEFSKSHNVTGDDFDKMLATANQKLLNVRNSRIRPSTDDKIITAWNAIMLTGYIDAYRALGKQSYLNKALTNARFLEQKMFDGKKGLFRNYKNGKASIPAFLDDYVLLANAFMELYEVTFDLHWLEKANELTTYTLNQFYDEKSSMFFYTSDLSEELIARKMEITDNVIPASNSVQAHNLYRLGLYYDNENFLTISRAMLTNVQQEIPGNGPYYANWALLLGLMTKEPFEIAIMGNEAVTQSVELQRHYLPTSLFMGGQEENLPLLEMKLVKGKTIIYVCQNKVCKLPVTEVSEGLKLIRQIN